MDPRRKVARSGERAPSRAARLMDAAQQFLADRGLFVFRGLPRGVDVAHDLARAFPRCEPRTVIDVGAHVGSASARWARAFPQAEIHAVEPVLSSFKDLERSVGGSARIHPYRLAFGAKEALVEMHIEADRCRSRVLEPNQDLVSRPTGPETVSMQRLDTFCSLRGIFGVDYLKIDTEGYDLEVLRGGRLLFEQGRVKLVEVEAGMNPDNTFHVPLSRFCGHLEPLGFRLFGLYEQIAEWPTSSPQLRRVNAVFVAPALFLAAQES